MRIRPNRHPPSTTKQIHIQKRSLQTKVILYKKSPTNHISTFQNENKNSQTHPRISTRKYRRNGVPGMISGALVDIIQNVSKLLEDRWSIEHHTGLEVRISQNSWRTCTPTVSLFLPRERSPARLASSSTKAVGPIWGLQNSIFVQQRSSIKKETIYRRTCSEIAFEVWSAGGGSESGAPVALSAKKGTRPRYLSM